LGNTEFKSCNSNIDCKYELLNSSGKGVDIVIGDCLRAANGQKYCRACSKSKEWKNFAKAVKNIRDSITSNKVRQSVLILMKENLNTVPY
jgi:hypothetical protein